MSKKPRAPSWAVLRKGLLLLDRGCEKPGRRARWMDLVQRFLAWLEKSWEQCPWSWGGYGAGLGFAPGRCAEARPQAAPLRVALNCWSSPLWSKPAHVIDQCKRWKYYKDGLNPQVNPGMGSSAVMQLPSITAFCHGQASAIEPTLPGQTHWWIATTRHESLTINRSILKISKDLLECDVVWHDVLSVRPDLVVWGYTKGRIECLSWQ